MNVRPDELDEVAMAANGREKKNGEQRGNAGRNADDDASMLSTFFNEEKNG